MDDDLDADVEGLSDPEMDMEKYRSANAGAVDADDEFAYEDAEFDDDVEAGDVSEGEDDDMAGESSADEDEPKQAAAPSKKSKLAAAKR
jgi:hypothetical protein